MKKVLVATDVPYWLRSKGNQQRIAELIDYLAGHFRVTVAYLGSGPPAKQDPGIVYLHLSRHRGLAAVAWRIYDLLPGRLQQFIVRTLGNMKLQRNFESFENPELARRFTSICAAGDYDALIIEYIWHGYLTRQLDRHRMHLLLDTHDIVHRRIDEYSRFGQTPDKTVTREQELAIYAQFDALIAIQQTEFDYLNELFPGRVILAMHPVRPAQDSYARRMNVVTSAERLTIIYFASYGDANLDAIRWFAESVWSTELAQQFKLEIHGAICDSVKISVPGITICGRSPSIEAVYRQADIAINPQRFGSGLKIKTIEALSFGLPVVTTGVGAEGLEALKDKAYLRADDADSFRQQLQRLIEPELRQTLSAQALHYVAEQLTPEACFGTIRARIEAPPEHSAQDRSR